ncbi:MAG TPA: hypothetical protein IAB72_02355 [Candidatus Onthoplasma faecipullorum]|nr:hypothetical protein [Candidatus Onthoplasma faecipullorum]
MIIYGLYYYTPNAQGFIAKRTAIEREEEFTKIKDLLKNLAESEYGAEYSEEQLRFDLYIPCEDCCYDGQHYWVELIDINTNEI